MEKRDEEYSNPGSGRLSLATQIRIASVTLLLLGSGLFKGEQEDPRWREARRKELEALKAYEDAPPGAAKEAAHMNAQGAWLERSDLEAELFDPKPEEGA